MGLVLDKKVIILNARSGIYSTPQMTLSEMSVNYIRIIMEFYGVQDIEEEVMIEGHNQYLDRSAEIITEGMDRTKAVAAGLSKVAVH